MHKKITRLALCALLFAYSFPAPAQQPKKVPRIGYLSASDPATAPPVPRNSPGFARAWLHRRTEHRHRVPICGGKEDRYPELAAELARLKVDIIVAAGGDEQIRAAKNATKTIPIVMSGRGIDPVVAGLVDSLARPGGNITGITNLSRELGGEAAGVAQRSGSQSSPCRGSLRSPPIWAVYAS